jgi:cysteine/O-acetylserine efflux protein
MENVNWFAFLSFAIINSLSPGPNNISSTSMGVLYGYKKTLPYLVGIATGFLTLMLLIGFASGLILTLMPRIEPVFRILGAVYILWLAWGSLRASYEFDKDSSPPLGTVRGMLLQFLNPKAIIYGVAIYTAFLAGLSTQPIWLLASATFLAGITFSATSIWTLFGVAISTRLKNPRLRKAINIILALLLIYNAVELSGLFPQLS